MTKITVFARGLLNNNKTQLQLTLNGIFRSSTDSNLTFNLDDNRIFTIHNQEELLVIGDATTKTVFSNFWFFVGARDATDKFYTQTWSGGDVDGCRLTSWRDM